MEKSPGDATVARDIGFSAMEMGLGSEAYYLFLRGMSPQHPEACGIHFDRPPAALIESLSRLLEGANGGAE